MKPSAGETDLLFKALADPTRRKIIALLDSADQSVKELTAAFAISQPAVSQHLRELRSAKLVEAEKVGLRHRYRLTGKPLQVVYEWSAQYRRFFDPTGHAWAFTDVNTRLAPKSRKGRSHGH